MSDANENRESSELTCPGCGKAIDALRAGHVAIIDGGFRYFCNRACKLDYLESTARPPADALTVRPPRVQVKVPDEAAAVELPIVAPDPPPSQPSNTHEKASPPPSSAAAVANESALQHLPVMGLVSAFLAFSLGLAGDGASRPKLACALLSGALLVIVLWRKRQGLGVRSVAARGFPTVVACGVALAATLAHAPNASSLTAFAGLAAFASLCVYLLAERAERSVEESSRAFTLLRQASESGEPFSADALESYSWLDMDDSRNSRTMLRHAESLLFSSDTRIDVHSPFVRFLGGSLERAGLGAFVLVLVAVLLNHAPLVEAVASASAAALAVSLGGAFAAVRTSIHSLLSQAIRRGVFYRDAIAFEQAGKTDIAVVCARGSVLMGEPEIISVEALGPATPNRVLELTAGAVQTLSDPSAKAVLREVRQRGITGEVLRSPLVHPGLGVTALTGGGETVVVGSRSFLLHEKVSVAVADSRVNALEGGGRSVLLVALANKLVGIVALQDGLRPGARAAIQKLLQVRIEPVLLSGEARETCETIARALDIDHVRPEVLPQERANEVKALGEAEHLVAVIGHLDTDKDALAAADFSVAMQGAVRLGDAGAVIASDDVRDATLAITLAKRARRSIQTTIAIGAAPGVAALIGIAFGAPRAFAPVAALLSALFAFAVARESANRNG